MKQGKKLTVRQSRHLKELGLYAPEWLLCKNANGIWTLEHRRTLELKEVPAMK